MPAQPGNGEEEVVEGEFAAEVPVAPSAQDFYVWR